MNRLKKLALAGIVALVLAAGASTSIPTQRLAGASATNLMQVAIGGDGVAVSTGSSPGGGNRLIEGSGASEIARSSRSI